MENLSLKVCGMREPDNIAGLVKIAPDFIGLIFYPKSARYVRNLDNREAIASIPEHINRVGVFVNDTLESVIKTVDDYQLDYVQLHGGESTEYCRSLKSQGIKIIKVFSVQDKLNMQLLKTFEGEVDYYLFDTKTSTYGGSGKTFDWSILKDYEMNTPYFLSGGIGLDELKKLDRSQFPKLVGLDVNSKFEDNPGHKNLERVEILKKIIS
ncbi:MAG: phosphoribosylanthranilate isomerase [Cyclobacteriaceae bacterium]